MKAALSSGSECQNVEPEIPLQRQHSSRSPHSRHTQVGDHSVK